MTKTMKRSAIGTLAVAASFLLLSGGCSVGRTAARVGDAGKVVMMWQELGPTLTQSTGEHMHTISGVIDMDTRALFYDLDMLYMTRRPTRLTPWHDR